MNRLLKNLILAAGMSLLALTVRAETCLPNKIKQMENNPKYIVKTVHGQTYQEAEQKLISEMTSSGFLQHIKVQEEKKLSNLDYQERKTWQSNFNANVEHWLKYSCKQQDKYVITAVIGKADVNYVDFEYPEQIFLKNLKKFCKGYSKIYVVKFAAKVHAEKQKTFMWSKDPHHAEYPWTIACGESKSRSIRGGALVDDNAFESFRMVEWLGDSYRDRTADMWLELTKNYQ